MNRVHLVKESSILKMYPTVIQKKFDPKAPRYQGGRDGAKHQGGLPPSTSMTNCGGVYEIARTFGKKNRDNIHVLSAPVRPKKR